jgi:hypothetical protein
MASIAGSFADRLIAERSTDRDRIELASEACFSRAATDKDVESGQKYLDSARNRLGNSPGTEKLAWLSYCRALLLSNEFFYVD